MALIGRNEPCPCGSGLKYKKCCMKLGATGLAEKISAQKLMMRVQQRSTELGEKKAIYFRDLKDVRKMSEIIIGFAQPLLSEADSFEGQKNALTLAIIAWNLSLTEETEEEVKNAYKSMGGFKNSERDLQFQQIMGSLIQRKLELYPEIKRLVMDFDVIATGNGFHLNVVSSPLDGDSQTEIFEKEADKLYQAGEITDSI